MPHFTATAIDPGQSALLFALVRIARPATSLPAWRSHAAELAAAGGGVIALRTADGTFHGLATWLPETHLAHGRALRVDTFIAFELSRRAPARKTLCEALQAIARDQGCSTVLYTLASRGLVPPVSDELERWSRIGPAPSGIQLAQPASA